MKEYIWIYKTTISTCPIIKYYLGSCGIVDFSCNFSCDVRKGCDTPAVEAQSRLHRARGYIGFVIRPLESSYRP